MLIHKENTAEQCACDTDDQHVHRNAKKIIPNETQQCLRRNSMLVLGTHKVLKYYQNKTVRIAPLKH